MQAHNTIERLGVDSQSVAPDLDYSPAGANPFYLQFKLPCGAWVAHACRMGQPLQGLWSRDFRGAGNHGAERRA